VANKDLTNPIDRFLEKTRIDRRLKAAPRASRLTLARRAYLDLLGLPPTPAQVDEFIADQTPQAWERLIDKLLASPHYGERYGRHWLDVARYADSGGFEYDVHRPNAWRYRDYVIKSFNDDKPYNVFLTEQIAGDEIDPKNPEFLVAVGFLRMGPWELTGMEVAKIARQRFLDDVTQINDWARSRKWTALLTGLSLLRNFNPFGAPRGMRFLDLIRQIDSHSGGSLGISKSKKFRWGLLTVAGMWFQDVFNYDFRRTEMCIIPYATQAGEISFCAYNTGIGWRKIVEKMHGVKLKDWYREKGRHEVYAKQKEVDLTALATQKARADAKHFEQVIPRSGPLLPVVAPTAPPKPGAPAPSEDGVAAGA